MKARQADMRAATAPADSAAFPEPPSATGPSGRARTGKIARLPHRIREALNERLREGLPCAEILSWLNALPEVRETLQKRFDGSPMTQDNISRWRHGGYAGWLENQQNKEAIAIMAASCRNIDQKEREELTSQIALAVTARMVVELRKFDALPEGDGKSAAWRELVWSLTLLRRGEFYHEKLRLERDKHFPPKEPEKRLCKEEQMERIREIMGIGGPHWNRFTKLWEGEGAEEANEKDEVERQVWAEMDRRKAERAAAAKAAETAQAEAPAEGAADQNPAEHSPEERADEEYTRDLDGSGSPGATQPEVHLRTREPTGPCREREPCPARLPEPRHPAAGSR